MSGVWFKVKVPEEVASDLVRVCREIGIRKRSEILRVLIIAASSHASDPESFRKWLLGDC